MPSQEIVVVVELAPADRQARERVEGVVLDDDGEAGRSHHQAQLEEARRRPVRGRHVVEHADRERHVHALVAVREPVAVVEEYEHAGVDGLRPGHRVARGVHAEKQPDLVDQEPVGDAHPTPHVQQSEAGGVAKPPRGQVEQQRGLAAGEEVELHTGEADRVLHRLAVGVGVAVKPGLPSTSRSEVRDDRGGSAPPGGAAGIRRLPPSPASRSRGTAAAV